MIITEILARNARMYGPETALIEREPENNRRRRLSWEEFHAQAGRLAQALAAHGVRKGDRVALLMTNCLEWLPVYLGVLASSAVAAPLNFRLEAPEIAQCARLARPRVFIFGPEFSGRIEKIKNLLDESVSAYVFVGPAKACPAFATPYQEFTAGAPDAPPYVEISPQDPAGLYFTSGTTGRPKAALLTHRNLEFAAIVENHHHNQTHADNFLCIPPLYHTGAKMHWLGNFIVGAAAVILRGVTPAWILEAVSQERCSIVWLLVPWAQDILLALESGQLRLGDYDLSSWRLMHIGAQPVPPSLIRQWQSVFPNHAYDTNYGLTESSGPGCVHLGLENIHKVGAIGRAGFDWEARVMGDDGTQAPDGEVGELWVKGPGVMREYYLDPEATALALKPGGWLATGDIARLDEDGFIWLVDRKKDVIITGGENIYPVEIEDFLRAHPKVADAGVIGLPDPRLGEIAAAVVRVKPGQDLDEAELNAFCQGLARYKRPRRFFFGQVPRNPTGKIEKPKLREKYAGAAASFKL